jgi:hypothetical protein
VSNPYNLFFTDKTNVFAERPCNYLLLILSASLQKLFFCSLEYNLKPQNVLVMMKKLFALCTIVFALSAVTYAQPGGGGNPEERAKRQKEMIRPQLMDKTKLTEDQANKVIDAYQKAQQETRAVRMNADLSDDDKKAKVKEINEARTASLKAIPLTDDQIKSVESFYQEMRKNMPQRGGGGN